MPDMFDLTGLLTSPSMGESRPQFGMPYEVNESADQGEGESTVTSY